MFAIQLNICIAYVQINRKKCQHSHGRVANETKKSNWLNEKKREKQMQNLLKLESRAHSPIEKYIGNCASVSSDVGTRNMLEPYRYGSSRDRAHTDRKRQVHLTITGKANNNNNNHHVYDTFCSCLFNERRLLSVNVHRSSGQNVLFGAHCANTIWICNAKLVLWVCYELSDSPIAIEHRRCLYGDDNRSGDDVWNKLRL